MEVSFNANVVLTLNHRDGLDHSSHVQTKFNLGLSDNLIKDVYMDQEDMLTKDGSHVLSNVLIQGLIGNLHMAHEFGFRDGAEHLRWIISELERGFVALTTIDTSTF